MCDRAMTVHVGSSQTGDQWLQPLSADAGKCDVLDTFGLLHRACGPRRRLLAYCRVASVHGVHLSLFCQVDDVVVMLFRADIGA